MLRECCYSSAFSLLLPMADPSYLPLTGVGAYVQ